MRRISMMLLLMVLTLPVLRVQAAPVTFTGADLLNLPAVSFPNGQPTPDADSSIVFSQPANDNVLFSLGLEDLVVDPLNVSSSIKVTRRSGDFDLMLAISDGVKAVGGLVANNLGGRLLGEPDITLLGGQSIVRGADGPFLDGVGFADLGTSFILSYDFSVSALGVDVTFGIFGQSLSFFSSTVLNSANGLSLILISDVNSSVGEIYEINALTLQNAQVPEPEHLFFFMLPLLGALMYRRRLF